MQRSFLYVLPLWLRIAIVIISGVIIGSYLAGDSTRKLDEQYLVINIRAEIQSKTDILANMLAESVVTKDIQKTESIFSEFTSDWQEITYLHVQDERGILLSEWRKGELRFDQGIRKFEAPIELGGVEYGVLSAYVDLNKFYNDMKIHIGEIRNRSALILLTISLFIIALVDLMVFERDKKIS